MRTHTEKMLQKMQNTICQSLEQIDGTPFHEDLDTPRRWRRHHPRPPERKHLRKSRRQHIHRKRPDNQRCCSDSQDRNGKFTEDKIPFFITSISLVIHPHNPLIPTTHAHYRYSEQGDGTTPASCSFNGSADLTPYYLFRRRCRPFSSHPQRSMRSLRYWLLSSLQTGLRRIFLPATSPGASRHRWDFSEQPRRL